MIRKIYLLSLLSFVCGVLIFVGGCSSKNSADAKVGFDANQLDQDGLIGPADGKRAVSYEFCIPDKASFRWQVRQIDPSVEFYPGSRGRSQCGEGMLLCIGSTHQEDYKAVLSQLAALEYVDRIEETVFE